MAKDYSEDLLIQKSTAELLEKELGWKSVYAFENEVLGEQGTLGRKRFISRSLLSIRRIASAHALSSNSSTMCQRRW